MKMTKQGVRDLNGKNMDGIYNGRKPSPARNIDIDRIPRMHDPRRCTNPNCEICYSMNWQ